MTRWSSSTGLIGPRFFASATPKRLRGQRRVARLGSEPEIGRRVGGVQVERAERARVVEDDARAVGEVDRRASEPRQVVAGAIDVPVASHAKVRVKHASVVEEEQLMLSATLDVAMRASATANGACAGEIRRRSAG